MMNSKLTRVALVATLGMLAVACTHDDDDDDDVVAMGPNTAPSITIISDQIIEANEQSEPIAFQVGDDFTAADDLTVSATSDNQALIPDQGLAFDGFGRGRALLVTPVPAQLGTANITVAVTDADGVTEQTTFQVTVDRQQVSASTFVQEVFDDAATDTPQELNSRVVVNDAQDTDFFTLLAP